MDNNNELNNTKKDNNQIFKIISAVLGVVVVILLLLLIFNNKGSKITVVTPSNNLMVGDNYQIAAEYKKGDKNEELVYVSEKPAVVTVNETTGAVTAVSEGTARIKIYVKDNPDIYEYITITVKGIKEEPTPELLPPEEEPTATPEPIITPDPTSKPKATATPIEKTPVPTVKPTTTVKPTATTKPKATATPAVWVSYSKSSYECTEGEVIDTMIRGGGATKGLIGYSSSDNSIVTVENGYQSGIVTNCVDCRAVHLTCKKAGKTTIKATFGGATTTSKVTVNEGKKITTTTDKPKGEVIFEPNSTSTQICPNTLGASCTTVYNCKAGDKLYITLTANAGSSGVDNPSVKSYSSNNTSIATIEEDPRLINCASCAKTIVTCKKAGSATLNATNNIGGTGKAIVQVK